MNRLERFNRLLWTLLGVLLAAGGGLATAACAGAVPGFDRHTALLPAQVLDTWRQDPGSARWILVAVGLLLAALGAWLLRAQLRPHTGGGRRLPDQRRDGEGGRGRTRIDTAAMEHALAADLRNLPQVRAGRVALRGTPAQLTVAARIAVAPDTDLPVLGRQIAECLDRFSSTTDLRAHHIEITVATQATGPGPVRAR